MLSSRFRPQPGEATIGTELNAVVAQRFEVAPGLMVLRVVPAEGRVRDFQPGQFAVIGLPDSAPRAPLSDPEEQPPAGKLIRRAYSIASASIEKDYLELYITLVRSGELTPRLFALAPGDRLWLGPRITGTFTLDQAPADRHVLLGATGTGLAPYMSMMRTVLHQADGRRFAVLLGARQSWDLGYHAELVTMARLSPSFSYLPVISRPCEELVAWSGATGRVTDQVESGTVSATCGFPITPETASVFLCGNPAMIESLCALLGRRGFTEHSRAQPGGIFVERYW